MKPEKLLYRYYPYNEYLLETLITKQAWYSKPETFNDPFDCHLNFDDTIPSDKYEKCIRWQLKCEGRSEEQIERDIRKLISQDGAVNNDAKQALDNIAESTLEVIRNIGVYCLSEVNANVTMWSHYAGNHSGICLGVLISEDVFVEKVTYVPKAPKVNFSELLNDGPMKNDYKWIFSKHHDWQNEKEWRIVVQQGNQLLPLPGKIKTVIFGLRMNNDRKGIIQEILKGETDIQYFEMIKSLNLLQLKAKRIEAKT